MGKVPKQRRPGQTGGSQRPNLRTAYRMNGQVRPPKKGCAIIALAGVGATLIAAATPLAYWLS